MDEYGNRGPTGRLKNSSEKLAESIMIYLLHVMIQYSQNAIATSWKYDRIGNDNVQEETGQGGKHTDLSISTKKTPLPKHLQTSLNCVHALPPPPNDSFQSVTWEINQAPEGKTIWATSRQTASKHTETGKHPHSETGRQVLKYIYMYIETDKQTQMTKHTDRQAGIA